MLCTLAEVAQDIEDRSGDLPLHRIRRCHDIPESAEGRGVAPDAEAKVIR